MTHPVSAPPPRTPRTLSRDERRTQLIEATIATISECGLSRTTLTEVARRAGLSHGLVLFHFETKEKLLVETLDYLSDEYRNNWQTALKNCGPAPEQRLAALIDADFSQQVSNPGRVNAWASFWGESQSRPIYLSKCGENDEIYIRTLDGVCAEMNAVHGYTIEPAHAARIIRIMIEGLWLEMMTLLHPYDPQDAKHTVWTCCHMLYPRHFGPRGPLAQG